MDPTARNDDPKIGDKTPNPSGNSHPSPIQPGQFVVAQEETKTPTPNLQPPDPSSIPKEPHNLPSSNTPPSPVVPTSPETAAATKTTSPPAPSLGESTKLQTPPPPENTSNQPDPTPFVPPQQSPTPAQTDGSDEPSKIAKFRVLLLAGAALILLVIIAALLWFFILNKNEGKSAKTELPQEQVEEPRSPPKRTTGGFGELPPATPEATESASPSPESQPTASPAQ